MFNRYVLFALCLLVLAACAQSEPVTLEFRLVEDEPTEGTTEMIFEPTGESIYLRPEVPMSHAEVDSAFVTSRDGRPAVELLLTAEGSVKFANLTGNNIGKRCALVLNGELVSAPRIMDRIGGGRALITGEFTEEEAARIAEGLTHPQTP